MSVELKNVTVRFDELLVLDRISAAFPVGKISVVLGPSGCGKTTILNLLTSGLKCLEGEIAGTEGLRFSHIFQEPRLLPWLTVEGNLRFVLDEIADRPERDRLCAKMLAMTGLTDYRDWYPGKLSGGMRQRVAIARAFAHQSDIILMDEPFQGLDLKRKLSLIDQFTTLWEEERRTVVMVTHDMGEALSLADRIFVLTEKPARLADSFTIELDRSERRPGTTAYGEYESRLYRLLS